MTGVRPEVEGVRDLLGVPPPPHTPAPLAEVIGDFRDLFTTRFGENEHDPDFDLTPMFRAEGVQGNVWLVTDGWADDEEKALYVGGLVEAMRGVQGEAWAVAMTAWGVDDPGEIERWEVPAPRDSPHREEWAVVQGSDGDRYELWRATVDRTPSGVRLGAWERIGESSWRDARGDLVTPFQEALASRKYAAAARLELVGKPDEWWTPERIEAVTTMLDLTDEEQNALLAGRMPDGRTAPTQDAFVALGLIVVNDGVLGPAPSVLRRAGLLPPCPSCGVEVGEPHRHDCEIARCQHTGGPRAECDEWGDAEPRHDCGMELWEVPE